MAKLFFAGALILLATGCGSEPVGAKVAFVETRVDETQRPLPFVIALKNSGNAAVDVTGVSLAAVAGFVLPSGEASNEKDTDQAIAADECQIEMREGHPVEVAARGDGVACGFVRWTPRGEAPPAIGVAAISFLVTLSDGETVETPPRVVLLANEAEAVETYIDELSLDRDAAGETLRWIVALRGEPTAKVERLTARLRSLSQ